MEKLSAISGGISYNTSHRNLPPQPASFFNLLPKGWGAHNSTTKPGPLIYLYRQLFHIKS